jgi:hypothetical protein
VNVKKQFKCSFFTPKGLFYFLKPQKWSIFAPEQHTPPLPVKNILGVDVSRSEGKIDTRTSFLKNRLSDTKTIKNGLDITSAIFRLNFKT